MTTVSPFLSDLLSVGHLVQEHVSCSNRECTFSIQSYVFSVNILQIVNGVEKCGFFFVERARQSTAMKGYKYILPPQQE